MNIPLLDLFKKFTGRRGAENLPAEVSHPVRVTTPKANGERLSKTVMPNTTRTSSTPDFFKTVGDSVPNVRAAATRALPPTVALALQPKVERAISLPLSDVVDQVPVGFLKPTESFDISQAILLKASEIEKGMADGKPAVSLFSIYEQVPDIFQRNVRPDDATQITVPQAKVLEQLGKMQVRDDQELESAVPQVDTPILKVTIEDTERFGTKLPAIMISADTPVKVEPATAKAFSSAEPEPAAKEKFTATTAVPAPGAAMAAPPKIAPRPSAPDPVAPARIPFKLPPKGTDETASQRVPASSGSSVPLSGAPVVPPPTRIPFKMTPPCNDLKPKLQIVPGVVADEVKKPAEAAPTNAKISLGLRAVAQNMPSFQLHRPADTVAADVRFELPLSLVESQLATGRVAVPVKTFRDALPEEYKSIVVIDAGESPVLLPLQEVLTNLSPDLLKMRDDQVVDKIAEGFETPFSIKAAEDAKRFKAEIESAKKSEEAPVETKPEQTPQAQAGTKPVVAESSVKPNQPDPKPVLKLSPIQPEQKAIAPVEAKTDIKFPAAPIKLASEVKTEATKPVVSAPPIEQKPEAQATTPPAAPFKVSLAPKPVAAPTLKVEPVKAAPAMEPAPKPELAKPKPSFSLPTEVKTQPPAELEAAASSAPKEEARPHAPLRVERKDAAQPSAVSPAPLKLSATLKSDAPKESAPKDVLSAPSLKIAAKSETPPLTKLMPTAPAPALSEQSQPLMQTNPVPSQVPAKPAAIQPIAIKAAVSPALASGNGPLPPQRVNSDRPLPGRTPTADAPAPNKSLEKPAEKAVVNTNAKAVVEEASHLNGISAATVLFEDGLALAGKLPEDVQAGGLCAMAPSILKKINRHTVETKFGPLSSMTLDWKNAQLTFFMAGAVCLGVMHTQPVLPAETHHRLTVLTGELSRTYAQPENKHVDH